MREEITGAMELADVNEIENQADNADVEEV